MPIEVSVQGARQLAELSKRLKEADRSDLQRQLRRHIRQAAGPVETAIRSAVMGVQVTRGSDPWRRASGARTARRRALGYRQRPRSTGLRARTAGAVMTSVTARGIRIKVSAARFGAHPTLPKYLSAELPGYRRWRRPVFGNTNIWVEQRGSPYFFVTIHRHRAAFRRAVFEAMDATAKEIAR